MRTSILPFEDCKQATPKWANHLDKDLTVCTKVCFGGGFFKGEYGSPLISDENELIGLGERFGQSEGKPDIFVSVYPYVDWINAIIRKHSAELDSSDDELDSSYDKLDDNDSGPNFTFDDFFNGTLSL